MFTEVLCPPWDQARCSGINVGWAQTDVRANANGCCRVAAEELGVGKRWRILSAGGYLSRCLLQCYTGTKKINIY